MVFCILFESIIEEMFVARDPLNSSLYMGLAEDGIVISSELKSIQSLIYNAMPFLLGRWWAQLY